MTRRDLTRLGVFYHEETGVVFHHSKHLGLRPLKPHKQNSKGNVYYCFTHENKRYAIREEKLMELFKEK